MGLASKMYVQATESNPYDGDKKDQETMTGHMAVTPIVPITISGA